jgi:hypothetical protein
VYHGSSSATQPAQSYCEQIRLSLFSLRGHITIRPNMSSDHSGMIIGISLSKIGSLVEQIHLPFVVFRPLSSLRQRVLRDRRAVCVCVCVPFSLYEPHTRYSRNSIRTICHYQSPQFYTFSFLTAGNNVMDTRSYSLETTLTLSDTGFWNILVLKHASLVSAIVCGNKKLNCGSIKSIGLLNFQSDGDI